MKAGTKGVALLALVGGVPMLTSIVLIEQALQSGREGLAEKEQALDSAAALAAGAYRRLFEVSKERFRLQARSLAAGFHGRIDDLGARSLRRWSVEPGGPAGAAMDLFPEGKWRGLEIAERLADGRTLRLEFVAPREWFSEFQDVGMLLTQRSPMAALAQEKQRTYRIAYTLLLCILLGPILLVGLLVARRVARRLSMLAMAARRVGRGDLDVQLAVEGHDEIAELSAAFNEMVGELGQSRGKIAYLEKMGAWQEVARQVAHEIKNPLTPVQLAVQQLASKYDDRDPAFRKLLDEVSEIVSDEVGTLRRLVEEFGAFARLPRAQVAPLDLCQALPEIVRGRPDWADLVTVESPPSPLVALVDRQLLRQALINLVQNAQEAGARQVAIQIMAVPGHCAHLVIDDNGPGIEPALRERLFDPYVTSKRSGTGLGLAIVRKIALEHGGDVSAEISPAGGARFVLRFPLA